VFLITVEVEKHGENFVVNGVLLSCARQVLLLRRFLHFALPICNRALAANHKTLLVRYANLTGDLVSRGIVHS
jgi:hypothetical protein